jgi:hypothetical protein
MIHVGNKRSTLETFASTILNRSSKSCAFIQQRVVSYIPKFVDASKSPARDAASPLEMRIPRTHARDLAFPAGDVFVSLYCGIYDTAVSKIMG